MLLVDAEILAHMSLNTENIDDNDDDDKNSTNSSNDNNDEASVYLQFFQSYPPQNISHHNYQSRTAYRSLPKEDLRVIFIIVSTNKRTLPMFDKRCPILLYRSEMFGYRTSACRPVSSLFVHSKQNPVDNPRVFAEFALNEQRHFQQG